MEFRGDVASSSGWIAIFFCAFLPSNRGMRVALQKSASRFPRVSHDFEIDVMTERRHTQAFIAMAYSMESYGRGVIISETLQND